MNINQETELMIPSSTMFIFWPGDEPPGPEEIRYRLLDWGAGLDREIEEPEGTLWSFEQQLAQKPMSFLVWCERVEGSYLQLLKPFAQRAPEAADSVRKCSWMIGIEGPLSLGDPLDDYRLQLAMVECIAADWAPAVYDACSFTFRTIEEVQTLVGSNYPPSVASLYTLHRVSEADQNGVVRHWIHSHGLERTGIPDLEIVGVSDKQLPAASELIETVAELWLEYMIPEAQTPFKVGDQLEVSWQPWQALAMQLPRHLPGGWNFRKPEYNHVGYRVVLVPATRPTAGPIWSPSDVLDQLANTKSTLYRTTRQTDRQAARARERWGDFGILFASKHPEHWRFAVKLGFSFEDKQTHTPCREHLWFDVKKLAKDRILGTLISEPCQNLGIHRGETQWCDLDLLTDWRIVCTDRIYDPETANTLLQLPM